MTQIRPSVYVKRSEAVVSKIVTSLTSSTSLSGVSTQGRPFGSFYRPIRSPTQGYNGVHDLSCLWEPCLGQWSCSEESGVFVICIVARNHVEAHDPYSH